MSLQHKMIILFLFSVFLCGCVFVPKPTEEELRLLDNPPVELKQEVDLLFPDVLRWYEELEKQYYNEGRSLTAAEKKRAIDLGIKGGDRVRVLVLEDFPMPSDKLLLDKAKSYGLGSSSEGARTMGNIIMIKPVYKEYSVIISHELVHVLQQERLGIEDFIKRYIIEMEIMGYTRSPLELEAYKLQNEIE